MVNIPGISGFTQPDTFARDRVVSRGVSIPGGLRIACIIGEGLREETIVESAIGGGADGDASCSPSEEAEGKFFKLQNAPVITGRTQLLLNDTALYGIEDTIDSDSFDGKFDFRIDPETGCIELQGASIGDQDGKKYSASTLNKGNGIIIDGTCGTFDLISVVDENAPAERWTVRCVGVVRDSNGDPIPGLATFTLTGSVSGQLRNSSGQPILFHSSYYTGTQGAASGSADPCADGFVVASSTDFGFGDAVQNTGDATPTTTDTFEFDGNLIVQGQALVGDELCIDGYVGIEIEDIDYDSSLDKTTLTLATDSLLSTLNGVDWEIRATNLFVDDPTVLHNGVTGAPATAGSFSSSDIGKILLICSGDTAGRYVIKSVTSSRRLRIESFEDSSQGFPEISDDNSDGFSEIGLEFSLLETNGILLLGIDEGTVPFETGDKFFIDVNSRVLKAGDRLEARYIAEIDVNDPQFFTSPKELAAKHGIASLTNTLTLGAQLSFENGAPGVLAIQAKPAIPRRTSVTLVEEVDSDGNGGFSACGGTYTDCEVDDLYFPIPRPISGLASGRPDTDTQVNIFIVRDDKETQIFPNKVPFYNSQLEEASAQNDFISSSDFSFSYTIVNTDTEITGQGFQAEIVAADGTFTTPEINFDAEDIGRIIVLQKIEDSSSNVYTTSDDISTQLFGSTTVGVELVITSIIDDSTVTVVGNDVGDTAVITDATDIQYFIKDSSDTTNVAAALLIHRNLVQNGVLKEGDGIRISYIDEKDADFFDTNWFSAYEAIEASDCQMVVPLPTQNRFGIFRAGESHVDNMSTIVNKKERVLLIGAQQGVTADALIGLEEAAVEDIGVLEGIQGDDPEEVLDGNIEDLINLKLSDNFTNKRVIYLYPDQIVRSINGTNTFIDGFYMAAAAAGRLAATQNVAVPLTFKTLAGFSILRDKIFRPITLNQLGAVGATVVQPVTGGGKILAGRTTSQSGFIEDEEISIVFIRDRIKQVLRDSLKSFIGGVQDENTQGLIGARVNSIMAAMVTQGLITSYEGIRVEQDKVDPRQWNVFLRFVPAFPVNFVFIDIEVGF